MSDYKNIYLNHAEEYDLLVSKEDTDGNLLRSIGEVRPLNGIDVVEFGAGTGRLTALMAPHVRSIRAFDLFEPMIAFARSKLARTGFSNVVCGVADNGSLPVEDGSADLSIAGWSFGHCTAWYTDDWRSRIASAIDEMMRVLRPDGVSIIIETLGTGYEKPFTPRSELGAYYRALVDEWGFRHTWFRTDYLFDSIAQGKHLLRLFWSDELVKVFSSRGSTGFPECTGLWWKQPS